MKIKRIFGSTSIQQIGAFDPRSIYVVADFDIVAKAEYNSASRIKIDRPAHFKICYNIYIPIPPSFDIYSRAKVYQSLRNYSGHLNRHVKYYMFILSVQI